MLTDEELHEMGGGPGKLKSREDEDKEAFERYKKKYGLAMKTADRMPLESPRKAVDAFK